MYESADYNTGMDDERDEKNLIDGATHINLSRSVSSSSNSTVGDAEIIYKMSCEDVSNWISSLPALGAEAMHVGDVLRKEYVDGITFRSMELQDFLGIGIDLSSSRILASLKARGVPEASKGPSRSRPVSGSFDIDTSQKASHVQTQYGQLLTLGYKGYKVSRGAVSTPIGVVNDVFCLTSRDYIRSPSVSLPPHPPPCANAN